MTISAYLCLRILAAPKARSILVSNAIRKGERLIPPVALDLLLRATFPAPSGRVKVVGELLRNLCHEKLFVGLEFSSQQAFKCFFV